MAELVYLTLFTVLSGAQNTQSARQTPKYCFLVGHVCCIHNIPQYRFSPAEYRQPKLPSSYQLHHLVLKTPFPSREKSAVFGIRTGDLSDQSQAL
jgi:hypothetical protein